MLSSFRARGRQMLPLQRKAFSTPTPELMSQLKAMGINAKEVVYNPQ